MPSAAQPVLTAAQMRAAEATAIDGMGIPALLLMENAGRAVALLAWHLLTGAEGGAGALAGPVLRRLRPWGGWQGGAARTGSQAYTGGQTGPTAGGRSVTPPLVPPGRRPRVVAAAGKGNNGGDALAAARHLAAWGCDVTVILWARPEELPPDARLNLTAVERLGLRVLRPVAEGAAPAEAAGDRATAPATPAEVAAALAQADLILDGLLGTGVRGAPREPLAGAIQALAASGRPILAIDLPSGVNTDTGAAPGPAVPATWTLALGAPKPAHFLYPGAGYCGELWLAEIGIPGAAIAAAAPEALRLVTPAEAGALLPVPPEDAHKGSRGRVLVVGGSRSMPGAPALAGLAALRAGAGLVHVAVPEPAGDLVAMRGPELITLRLPAAPDGGFGAEALAPALAAARGMQAVAIGPGLGTGAAARGMVRELVASLPVPAVLDADGIRAFAGEPEALRGCPVPLVLTPHPGELAALLGTDTAQVQADRLGAVAQAVERTGQTVVLKGPHTLVGAPDGRVFVNLSGSRALATAGSGDVLTGMVAALLAQGLGPVEAAVAAVAWHGLAGERLGERLGPDGVLAGDLLTELPAVRREMRRLATA
ncbi:MAG: NAD(P)H-hydrate dehydratase [Firmicutes bacterium]|nr:NAD(P)H-hydrate dehydratase [Bacillota bacterium]